MQSLIPTLFDVFQNTTIIAICIAPLSAQAALEWKVNARRTKNVLSYILIIFGLLAVATFARRSADTDHLLIVNGETATVSSGVEVSLRDVMSLRAWGEGREREQQNGVFFSHGDHRSNILRFSRGDIDKILSEISSSVSSEEILRMNQEQFEDFLSELRDEERQTIGAIPLGEFEISSAGRTLGVFRVKSGETIRVPIGGGTALLIRVHHIFNTRQRASKVKEAAYISIIN